MLVCCEPCEDFEPCENSFVNGYWDAADISEDTVDAEADDRVLLFWLDVEVRGVELVGVFEEGVNLGDHVCLGVCGLLDFVDDGLEDLARVFSEAEEVCLNIAWGDVDEFNRNADVLFEERL